MFNSAKWIGTPVDLGDMCPVFKKSFALKSSVKSAILRITAIGAYEAHINGARVGRDILTPGLTSYKTRLMYQSYDVSGMLSVENKTSENKNSETKNSAENEIAVTLGKGWHRGRISDNSPEVHNAPGAVLAELELTYADGEKELVATDETWQVWSSRILSSDIYDGEIYDATAERRFISNAAAADLPKNILIPAEGEPVREQERISPVRLITTPRGEKIIDFGQNFAGYPEITATAAKGDKISLSVSEILDSDGNFYNGNYRSAKAKIEYTCRDGEQTFKPHFTFMGFRYAKIDEYPGEIRLGDFMGIAVYSDMARTGRLVSANEKLNKLFENAVWSQRANFIDIPTDCPQRDERMGWTGDAQIFCRTAAYNYDVYRFFSKWLADVRAEQRADGSVPDTVPNFWQLKGASAAWGDVICVVPWQMYLMYGDKKILADNFDAMKKWVDYMTADTADKYLWTRTDKADEKKHYGDWLALDAPYGSYKGSTDDDFIASAFYAYSTELLVKSGCVIGKDVSKYEELLKNIRTEFKKRFNDFRTQTECVLALHFNLTDDRAGTAEKLVKMLEENGWRLKTGFVGTPYLPHALSESSHTDAAYRLLLQEEYPSWLYEVNHGATTVWEHWDGIRDDGRLWSADMNSYNHYAYGAVLDWVYSVAAGICPDENAPGFEKAIIAPHPNKMLGMLGAELMTRHGKLRSFWSYTPEGTVRYEIDTPVRTKIIIDGNVTEAGPGSYVFTR